MNLHAADLILSGHNHDLHVDFDGRVLIVESEQDANYVTVIDIDIRTHLHQLRMCKISRFVCITQYLATRGRGVPTSP